MPGRVRRKQAADPIEHRALVESATRARSGMAANQVYGPGVWGCAVMADNPDFIQAQKYLDGVDYPADRDTLVEHARRHGADEEIIQTLEGLPDRTFERPTEVSREITRG